MPNMSLVRAVEDFKNNPEWAKEYEKSDFKEFISDHSKMLNGEQLEKT